MNSLQMEKIISRIAREYVCWVCFGIGKLFFDPKIVFSLLSTRCNNELIRVFVTHPKFENKQKRLECFFAIITILIKLLFFRIIYTFMTLQSLS